MVYDGHRMVNSNINHWLYGYKCIDFNKFIGSGISIIPRYAFAGFEHLEEVYLSDYIEKIGTGAFCSCPNLRMVKNIDYVTIYGNKCFSDCPNLEYLEFSDSEIDGSHEMFANCTKLKRVDFNSSSIYTLGDYCFKNCISLEKIYIPDSVRVLGKGCFLNCTKLEKIDLPVSVFSIGDECFKGCSNLKVIYFNTRAVCSADCFEGCTNLEKINFSFSTSDQMRSFLNGNKSFLKKIIKISPKVVLNFILRDLDIYDQYDVTSMIESLGLTNNSHFSIQRETIPYEPYMDDDHISYSNMFFIDMVKSIADNEIRERIIGLFNSCQTLPDKVRRTVLNKMANIFNDYLNSMRGYKPKYKQDEMFYSFSLTIVKSASINELNKLENAIDLSRSSIDYVNRYTEYRNILVDGKRASNEESLEGKLGMISSNIRYLNSELYEKYISPIFDHLDGVIDKNQKLLKDFVFAENGNTLVFGELPDDILYRLVDTAYDSIKKYMEVIKPLEDIRNAMSETPQDENLILNDLALFIIEIKNQINSFLSEKYKTELDSLLSKALSPYKNEIDSLLAKKSGHISNIYSKLLNKRIRIVLNVFLSRMYFLAQRDDYMKKCKNIDVLIDCLEKTVYFLKSNDDKIDEDEYNSNIIYSYLIDLLRKNFEVPFSRLKNDPLVKQSLINLLNLFIDELDGVAIDTVEDYNKLLYTIMFAMSKVGSEIAMYYDKKVEFESLNPVYSF